MGWIITGAVLFILLVIAIGMYNSLVKAKQKVENSWGQIYVQLQRRYDLIPNLIELVKGYMSHEEELLLKITQLRTAWMATGKVSEKLSIGKEIDRSVNRIWKGIENYPELKANELFIELQEKLTDTENKISFGRQFYNDCVTMYNTKIAMFPGNIFAKMYKFKPEKLYSVENDDALEGIKVNF